MTRSMWILSTSRLAVAAAFAAGLAAAPWGMSDGSWRTAAAQESDSGNAGNTSSDEHGEAMEFPENPKDRTGGTGSIGISSGEQRYADPASVNVVDNVAFERYAEAAEQNDLEEAGLALSEAADRPVTNDYVAEVNRQLGVSTSLTDEQIAEAANDEPLPY